MSDVVAGKLSVAQECGAVAVLAADLWQAVRETTSGRGADVVVECSGRLEVVADTVRLAPRGGTVVLVGFQAGDVALPLLDIVLGELRILGSAAHLWDVDMAAAVALLRTGAIRTDPLLTDIVPLEHAVERGFRRALNDPACIKIAIRPHD